jgi:hypothetical protein
MAMSVLATNYWRSRKKGSREKEGILDEGITKK